jgi:hypothetical protein
VLHKRAALRSIEHVYHEAASMFPANEDLMEHSGDLTRKKQLVLRDCVATKKAAFITTHLENIAPACYKGSKSTA